MIRDPFSWAKFWSYATLADATSHDARNAVPWTALPWNRPAMAQIICQSRVDCANYVREHTGAARMAVDALRSGESNSSAVTGFKRASCTGLASSRKEARGSRDNNVRLGTACICELVSAAIWPGRMTLWSLAVLPFAQVARCADPYRPPVETDPGADAIPGKTTKCA